MVISTFETLPALSPHPLGNRREVLHRELPKPTGRRCQVTVLAPHEGHRALTDRLRDVQPGYLRSRASPLGDRRQERHPEAGGDQAAERTRLVAFADNVWDESCLAAGLIGDIARP